eukprot:CAMPEP_0172708044 /NCGR_PEP_ID=MMETSP1074-20121228/50326_1 /TAXON_ID=2916 /ORGANISM="Ceratium fusus, Strain PA161109" /LENGTH=112 /DNA_ID=CAMNT_0013530931 /DNA_START=127 /DNA_END=465 /DNA_ORIENTATION=-
MNKKSSDAIGSGSQYGRMADARSMSQTSRPGFMVTSPPVRLSTKQVVTKSQASIASSQTFFNGITFLPRIPSSAVTMIALLASKIRSFKEDAEKPAKTTECTHPIRQDASMT